MNGGPVVVLGAGVAGLTAANQFARAGVPVMVVEGSSKIAGMAESHVGADGFTYDIGAHFITNRLAGAVGISAQCRVVPRYGEVVKAPGGRFLGYPLGLLGTGRYLRSAISQRLRGSTATIVSAADQFRHDYGPALAEEIANPILASWSGLPADRLAASVAEKIPHGLLQVLWLRAAQQLSRRAVANGYCRELPQNAGVFHVYPTSGVAEVCRALARRLTEPVKVNHPAQRIYVKDEKVVGVRIADRDVETGTVVSTLPINRLGSLVEGSARLARFAVLRYRALVMVNVKLLGRGLLRDVMVWTPHGYPFFRLTEAPASMPWLAPPQKTMVLCEMSAAPGDEVWTLSDDEATRRCLSGLEDFIPDLQHRVLGISVMRQPLGYPIFSLEYEDQRADLATNGTGVAGLHSIGRNGEFEHILMEDIYWRTVRRMSAVARQCVTGRAHADELEDLHLHVAG